MRLNGASAIQAGSSLVNKTAIRSVMVNKKKSILFLKLIIDRNIRPSRPIR